MSMYPLVQAVTAPDPAAEVLFDFNDEGTWATGAGSGVNADGWTLGTPQRLSSSGDPRTSWGPRRCEFRLRISGDRYAAQSVQSRLARVLMRPEFWLRFQLDAGSHPVWLRVVGADPGDLSFETVFVDRSTYDHWTVGVGLDAEPFAYGERVVLSTLTLPADPATGMWLALPDILGDAPARLRVTLDPAPGDGGGSDVDSADVAVHVAPVATSGFVTWQAEAFTNGTGTTTEANAGSSGGSRKRVDFASPAMTTRFYGTAPTAVPAGIYRVWARCVNTSTTRSVPARLSLESAVGETVTIPTSTDTRWQDFGTFAIPAGLVDLPGISGGSTSPYLTFEAGAGNLTTADDLLVDAFALAPVRLVNAYEEATSLQVDTTGYWETLMLDGDYEVPYAMKADGTMAAAQGGVSLVGGWPEARPGVANTLAAFRTDKNTISDSVTVTVSYLPRWIWLAPDAG